MNKIIVLSITLMVGYVGVQFIGGAVSSVSNCISGTADCGTGYRPEYAKKDHSNPTFYGDYDR